MTDLVPMWIAGEQAHGDEALDVRHPFDGALVGATSFATPEQVERAVAAAHAAVQAGSKLSIGARAEALRQASARLAGRAEEAAALITAENGKPIMWAKAEVARAVSVLTWAAEETRQGRVEAFRLDTDLAGERRLALVRHVARGAVLGISPFNFPLNLAVHKVAPAIAVGAPIVLKPAPKTPLSALLLGELFADTDLPDGMLNVLNVPNDRVESLTRDRRLPVVSFTGSGPVGRSIRRAVPDKHVTLELGGNAAAVVCADYADLEWAAARIAMFSNYQAGQSCVAVQRVYADEKVYDRVRDGVVSAVSDLVTGDPRDPSTQVGPLIDVAAAERVEQWVAEAVRLGARVLVGGVRDGATFAPTVLEDVPGHARLACEEVFGPVLVLDRVIGVDDAFARVNDSRFGLQAGVFTTNLQTAFRAHAELDVGGVVIGDVPSYRADQMPYGGVKESGVGREGLRYAMHDFTYDRVMVLTGLEL
jgi:aldehyde dehydrogenase (NAD+)